MSLLDTATIATLETVINAKRAIDDNARDALHRLQDKSIRVRTPGTDLMFTFEDAKPRITSVPTFDDASEDKADATITGSAGSILEAVFREDGDNIIITGNESLIEDFRVIFRANVEPAKVTEQIRAFSEYGVATVKSALQGFGANASNSDERLQQLENEVDQLRAEIEHLKAQYAAKGDHQDT